MKTRFLILVLIVSNFCFSQSKKQQIELLNKSVDSLEKELSIQKDMTNQSQIKGNLFETENSTLKTNNLNLQSQIIILNSTNESLTNTIGLTKYELQQKVDEINSKNKEISNLQTELISIKDSLTQLYSELNKTPKNTKNDVSNKNNSSNSERKYYLDEWEEKYFPTPLYSKYVEKSSGNFITGTVCTYPKERNDGWFIEWKCIDGIPNGSYTQKVDSRLLKKGQYKNGREDGLWIEYHDNGREKRKTEYRNGTKWEDRCYDTNGDEIKPCP